MWFSFYAVFRKEFLHITRDKGTLRVALMMPVVQLLLFGLIDQTVHDVPTVVVDQDRTAESRLLMDGLRASKTFRIITLTSNPDDARRLIREGKAQVGVIIPPKYHDRKLRKDAAQVLVLIDGSDSTVSAQALASVNGLVARENAAEVEKVEAALAAQPVILFNPEGRTANFIIPGLIAVLLMMVGIVFSGGAIVREKEHGTFEQLLVTPINPIGLILGKLGPYLFLGIIETGIVLFLMRFAFGVPIRGSMLFLFAMVVVYLFTCVSAGLLISTKASTQMESFQIAQSLFLPAIFLSGYIFPFSGMPFFLRAIGQIFPTTHMIRIMRGIILRDANALDLWPSVAALVVTSIIMVFFAARSVHKVAA